MARPLEPFSFDDQAGAFERRTGVPAIAAEATARDLVQRLMPGDGDLLVDMGAGSGELGRFLAEAAPRYVGLDLSRPMLAAFRAKRTERPWPLAQADASAPWPLRAGSVRVAFFARSAHLLDPRHVIAELRRVAAPGGAWVVIGRVEREATSMRSQLREEMLRLLEAHAPSGGARLRPGGGGGSGRGQGRSRRGVLRLEEALMELGAEVEAPRVGGRWSVDDSLEGVLADWRSKSGLGGRDVDPEHKRQVLEALAHWGAARFGTLTGRTERGERRFEWTPIRLPDPIPRRNPERDPERDSGRDTH